MGVLEKLRARLNRAGLRPSTRRGQNFLLDFNQLRFIVETAALEAKDVVLEVGPGTGFLTRRLALTGSLVLAVELDRGLLPLAQEETSGLPNVMYLQGDILARKNAINPEVLEKIRELAAIKRTMLADAGGSTAGEAEQPVLKCVSNLPYSAGTPFVMNLLCSDLPWQTGVFLLQKEVAERMTALPGGKDYGALSIAATLAAAATIERIVTPHAFWPRPNVDSAIILMKFLPLEKRTALPWKGIKRIAAAVFGSRRKILRNALKGVYQKREPEEILAQLAIDPTSRGESMTPQQFAALGAIWQEDNSEQTR